MSFERDVSLEMIVRLLRMLWERGPSMVSQLSGEYHQRYLTPQAFILVPEALQKMESEKIVAREKGWRTWWSRLVRFLKNPSAGQSCPRHATRIYWAITSEEELRAELPLVDNEMAHRILAVLDDPRVWPREQ